jgi:hypothetical protein
MQVSNGVFIPQVDSMKYLGCIFDNNLSFDSHVKHVIDRIKPVVSILAKLKPTIPTQTLLNIYNAHI